MTDIDYTQLNAFQSRFETLRRAIDDAIYMSEQGKIPPMSKLAFDVEKLCNDVSSSPPALQHAVQPMMGDVIALLDTLEFKLRDVKQALEDEG